MATSRTFSNAFEAWLHETFSRRGAFTMFMILMKEEPTTLAPLGSSYLHVIGDDVVWPALAASLNASGFAWDNVAIFAGQDGYGQIFADNEARDRLRELESAVIADRLVIQKGALYDRWGRELKLERMYEA